MKAVPFASVAPGEWDAACEASGDAWLYHRAAWVAIEETFFVKQNVSFALVAEGRIAAVQPLYVSELGLGSFSETLVHSGIHRHAGLAAVDALDAGQERAARAAAMREIERIASTASADRIHLSLQNLAPDQRGPNRVEVPYWLERGFYLGLCFGPGGMIPAPGMSTCSADQIVDLAPDPEVLFSRLDEECRRAVRKAESAGLAFEPQSDAAAIDRYFALATRSAERTGESLPPIDYYRELWRALSGRGACALLFVLRDGEPVAGLLLGIDKRAASFVAASSAPDALSLRVNDYLHWRAMLWMKGNDISCYRLGPTFPELPADWPISRVSRFKAKFGAQSRLLIQGSRFIHPQRYVELAKQHLDVLAGVADKAND